jgi:hypothetical protein
MTNIGSMSFLLLDLLMPLKLHTIVDAAEAAHVWGFAYAGGASRYLSYIFNG